MSKKYIRVTIAKQIFLITNKNISKFDTILPLTLNGKVQ